MATPCNRLLVFRPPVEIIKAGSEDEEVDPSSNRARAGSTSAPSPSPRCSDRTESKSATSIPGLCTGG